MTDNELKRTLQDGMRQVAFSDDEKHRLAAQLKQAMRAGKAAPAPAPAPSKKDDRYQLKTAAPLPMIDIKAQNQ